MFAPRGKAALTPTRTLRSPPARSPSSSAAPSRAAPRSNSRRARADAQSAVLIDTQAQSLTLAAVCDLEWPSDNVPVCLSPTPFRSSGPPRIASW
eukprot:4411713-Pyramimonas_sp.AAC.1